MTISPSDARAREIVTQSEHDPHEKHSADNEELNSTPTAHPDIQSLQVRFISVNYSQIKYIYILGFAKYCRSASDSERNPSRTARKRSLENFL